MSRDQVIAAIYETVIQPDLYDAFMDAWDEHIQLAIYDPGPKPDPEASQDGRDTLDLDPELQAHFTRAYDILEQIGRKVPHRNLHEQVRQSSGFSILARPNGQILAAGTAAAKVLDDNDRLEALSEILTANSAQLLQGLQKTARDVEGSDASVVLSTGAHPRHLIARITLMTDDTGQARQIITIDALDYQWSERAAKMLVVSFSLSPAEVEIVRSILGGYTLREIAELSGRSEHTVRNQSKSVLAKTGAPSQVDLIRLVAFLINADTGRKAVRTGNGTDALPHEMLTMSTGLEMQLFQTGPANGRPVIFLHGMLDGISPLLVAQKHLKNRGFRVLAPIRPGYGLSDPVAKPAQALALFTGHVQEVITRFKLKRPIILGNLAGAIYGYHLCSELGTRLGGMVVAGAVAPVTRLSQLADMAPRQRLVAYTARYAPALLPFVLRAGISQIDSKEIEGFMEALFPSGSHDRDMMEQRGLTGLVQSGYRFSVLQGHLGFATDSHYVVRDWSESVAGSPVPIIHFHGARDPVVSQASLRLFISTQKDVQFRLLKKFGQLVFFEDPDLVLDAIEELFGRQDRRV
ncbi:MAG: alpha/beta fold hydrolase [Rhodobacteraceae bacterium]|nr:alpha/beta fold hydrolase [Paracoccaceae bacterium]